MNWFNGNPRTVESPQQGGTQNTGMAPDPKTRPARTTAASKHRADQLVAAVDERVRREALRQLNFSQVDNPVVAAVDERIRLEALRQLDSVDLDDPDTRLPPLSDLMSGLTVDNSDEDDDPDFGFLDLPPTRTDGKRRENP